MGSTEHLTRQMDLIPCDKLHTPITVVGAGAIGSWTTLALAKMGFTDITVFDFDTIEVENMNCQFYRFSDIGSNKAEALKSLVKDFTGVEITAVPEYWDRTRRDGIMISAVDSMEARRSIWEKHKNKARKTQFIIDPRMGAEIAMMYVINPLKKTDITSYEKTLYSDSEAHQERCTAKATIYTANMLSGLVAKAVKNIISDQAYPRITMWSIAANDMEVMTQQP